MVQIKCDDCNILLKKDNAVVVDIASSTDCVERYFCVECFTRVHDAYIVPKDTVQTSVTAGVERKEERTDPVTEENTNKDTLLLKDVESAGTSTQEDSIEQSNTDSFDSTSIVSVVSDTLASTEESFSSEDYSESVEVTTSISRKRSIEEISQILQRKKDGVTFKEISREFGISVATVRYYVNKYKTGIEIVEDDEVAAAIDDIGDVK